MGWHFPSLSTHVPSGSVACQAWVASRHVEGGGGNLLCSSQLPLALQLKPQGRWVQVYPSILPLQWRPVLQATALLILWLHRSALRTMARRRRKEIQG